MLRGCIVAAHLALLLTVPAAASPPAAVAGERSADQIRAALDREVPGLLAEHKVPSVSIALIRQGRIVLAAAYGVQSPGVAATTHTLYNIASLTKPLTAEVVLRLASQGFFSLDEPMAPYWTDPDIAADPRRMKLTPRLALSHQTGFPNWRDDNTGLRFARDPGSGYSYSGEGYQYVARFVEKRLGRSFDELAQSNLFDPVGMASTAFARKPWFDGRVAIPADADGKPLEPHFTKHRYNAADLVYSTPQDYAAFMVAVWKDKGLTPVIARERARIQASMMGDCQGAAAATCPPELGFGLGWEVANFPRDRLFLHTGHDDGLYTVAYLDKTTGDGAAIFTNGQNGSDIAPALVAILGACPACVRFLQVQI